MKPSPTVRAAAALLLVAISPACNRLRARDQLNKGVNAFRNAQFQQAVNHFQQAVSYDPTFVDARLYLAMSYFQQYVPGGESPDNIKIAHQAIDAFEDVLKIDPKNTTALATIGLIYYNLKDFDKAKQFQLERERADPNNPEPYYWIGVINWALCFKSDSAIRGNLRLTTPNRNGDLPRLPEKARAELQQKNGALIDEALQSLQKAIELKPNYADAMAYMNLILRQKADVEAEGSAREADITSANDWIHKAMQVRSQTAPQPATTSSQ